MMPLHIGVQATDLLPIKELERRAETMERALLRDGRQVAHISTISSSPPILTSIVTPPTTGPCGDGLGLPHLHFVETKGLLKVTVEFDDPEFYEAARADDNVAGLIRLEICGRLGARAQPI